MAAAQIAFQWEARTRSGETKKGVMEAESEEAVHNKLKLQLLQPVSVKKQPKQLSFNIGTGVKTTDIVIFTRLFATMIDAGLPIVQCLDILSAQAENKRFGKILQQVKMSVEGGLTLSDSLRKHPKIFDQLFVNLVAAGEAGGILDTILQRVSTYMEKSMKLKRRVKGAMTYPIAVLGIAGIVVAILLTKVVPVFEKMFKDFGGGKLPAPTQFVIDASHAMVTYLPYILGLPDRGGDRLEDDPADEEGAHRLRRHAAEAAGAGAGAAQGRGGPLHPHHGHPAGLRRPHPRRHGDRGQDRRQQRRAGRHHVRAGQDLRG
jgi:type IV pilus assembly protein PilC